MESPALGIDLGTTNSVVAVANGREARVLADGEGRRLIPSVVSFHPDGSILVGHDARERRLVDAANTIYSIKRLIGRPYDSAEVRRAKERLAFGLEANAAGGVQVRVRRGTFALPEISAMVLRHLRAVAESALGETCRQAVITVPANFNELQRSATQAAGKVAGLEVLRVLNEPTAATLAYGYGRERPEKIAVYDLGGGTFDLTVLDLEKDVFEVVSTAGDTFLGGDDFDVLIADRMAAQCLAQHRYDPKSDPQTYERLRAAAEWAKCQLSAVADVDVTLEELFQDGRGRTVDFQFHMTAAELEQLILPLVTRSFDVVSDALRAAGRRPKEIESVVLVGGSTRIPLVRRMVAEYFQREPRADIDPDLVVAQGAAIHAFTLRGAQPAKSEGAGAARALAKAAAPRKPAVPVPGTALGRVPLRRQPAFAPEDPRDQRIAEEPTRIAQAPTRQARPAVAEERVVLPKSAPIKPLAPEPTRVADAREEAARAAASRPEPEARAARGGTSPLGIPPAQRTPFGADLDTGFEEEATRVGARPSLEAELSTPFAETPSTVAVVPSFVVTGSPASPPAASTPRRPTSPGLMELDPFEAPPQRTTRDPAPGKPREPTMPIATGPVAAPRPVREPTMQMGIGAGAARPIAPPAIAPPAGPPAIPVSRPAAPATGPLRTPTGTWGEEPARAAPPPPPAPPARAAERTQIEDALYGASAALPVPAGPPAYAPAPAPPPAAPAPDASPPLSWSDFQVGSLPPASLPAPAAPSPQMGAPRQPVVAMAERSAPLLMDVTPLALGLETAGGFVQHIVARNAPIPTEKTRLFSTAKDDQTDVEVRICQGDSNLFQDNQALGTLSLSALRKAPRGAVRIEVTFMIDASGILDVKATDLDTKRQQTIRIALKGGVNDAEIRAMRERQAQLFPSS
ncbi:MAG: Hsp70 family protein [Sandaracinus sp.]